MKRLLPVLMGFALLLLSSTEGWSLPRCPESGVWNNCFGTYTSPRGNKYVGEWKDNKYHGQGTYIWTSGKFAGDKYVGEYKDNQKHGQGTYTWSTGNKYVGEWKDNKRNGQGTWTGGKDLKGNRFIGAWKDDKMHGQGTFTYTTGTVNEGIWENGEFKYARKPSPTVTAEKSKQVRNDGGSLPPCKGSDPNKWTNCNGTGSFDFSGSDEATLSPSPTVTANQPCSGTYKPTWDNCTGTRTFSDKSKYTGQWKSGKEHGEGTLTYADGEKYVGGFKDGLHHGKGTITHANGKTLKGIWENDKFKTARD